SFTAGNGESITLNHGNVFGGTVTLLGQLASAELNAITSIDLGGADVNGPLTVSAVGITQSGALAVDGTAIFDAGAGVLLLDHAANDFTAAVELNNTGAFAVAVTDVNGLNLGAST